MDRDNKKERLELEEDIAKLELLAREFPDGAVNGTVVDLINDLKDNIRALDTQKDGR